MSVWLTIPSARPPEQVEPILNLWRERGYHIALWRDPGAAPVDCEVEVIGPYPGYAAACNGIIKRLMRTVVDPVPEWFVCAGDDTEPDPNKAAATIAAECMGYFGAYQIGNDTPRLDRLRGMFGVMQPTGDRWHEGVGGFASAPIDRVAGSAWYGREYCRRMYQGCGPLFPGYTHMFVDEEAQEVAQKMGVFWQRRDLVQRHNHWGRGATDQSVIELKPGTIPPHLEQWNTAAHWNQAKGLFTRRKAAGFPGHEPIP